MRNDGGTFRSRGRTASAATAVGHEKFDNRRKLTIPCIPVHSIEDAPQAAQERLQALKAQVGKVLNIYGEMAHAPIVLAAYGGIQDAIAEHGTFDAHARGDRLGGG